jgi:hypothetical protein
MSEQSANNANKKRNLFIIIIILAVLSILFRIIGQKELEQTSFLFIGLPTILALLVIKYTDTPKTSYGIVFRVVTLFLLISGIVLGEGLICIIMAAPLFYGVAAIAVFIYEICKKQDKEELYSFIFIPLAIMLAQPFSIGSAPESQTVITSIIVSNNIEISALNKQPDFSKQLPNYFKLGFPNPLGVSGLGLEIGDSRDIQFQSSTKGIGTLSLEVIKTENQKITFQITSDDTHIAHWLSWKEFSVELKPLEGDKTQITWTSEYTCDLAPKWYFEPLENHAVELMNEHLINSYFAE